MAMTSSICISGLLSISRLNRTRCTWLMFGWLPSSPWSSCLHPYPILCYWGSKRVKCHLFLEHPPKHLNLCSLLYQLVLWWEDCLLGQLVELFHFMQLILLSSLRFRDQGSFLRVRVSQGFRFLLAFLPPKYLQHLWASFCSLWDLSEMSCFEHWRSKLWFVLV